MKSYSIVPSAFWQRGPGKKLRGNLPAISLVLYLGTCPNSNMVGIFYVPFVMLCHDLGLSEPEVRELLALPAVAEVVQYDFDAELAWLPGHAREQLGESLKPNDKRHRGVQRELETVGYHPFAAAFVARYAECFALSQKPHPSSSEAPSKGSLTSAAAAEGASKPPATVTASDTATATARPGSAEGLPEAARPSTPAPAWDERETPCPLDLVAKLKALGVHVQLAEALKVDVDSVVAELDEFVSYWTIGEGQGQRRRNWAARARERVRKRAGEGMLKPPGAVDHAQRNGLSDGTQAAVAKILAKHKPPVREVG